jgi:hypothetical protein
MIEARIRANVMVAPFPQKTIPLRLAVESSLKLTRDADGEVKGRSLRTPP